MVRFRGEYLSAISKRDVKGLSNELSSADGRKLNVVVKGHFPLCHGCQSRGHFKKECPRTEHPMKAAGEKADKKVGATCSTMEVQPVAIVYDEFSPGTGSGDVASPKVKCRQRIGSDAIKY